MADIPLVFLPATIEVMPLAGQNSSTGDLYTGTWTVVQCRLEPATRMDAGPAADVTSVLVSIIAHPASGPLLAIGNKVRYPAGPVIGRISRVAPYNDSLGAWCHIVAEVSR